MRAYNVFVSGPKFSQFWSPNLGGGLVDQLFFFRCHRSRGISTLSGTKFGRRILRSLRYRTVKPGVSISPCLGSVPGYDTRTDGQTGGRTDRITVVSARLTLRAVASKNLVFFHPWQYCRLLLLTTQAVIRVNNTIFSISCLFWCGIL